MARHGVAAVRTRDILNLAGQRNQSALHYHFGNKEGLIRAVLQDQMKRIDPRLTELLASVGDGDALGILRAALLPIAEDVLTCERGRDQLSLLTQFVHCPSANAHAADCDYDDLIRHSRFPGVCDIRNRIWEAMPPLSDQMRTIRFRTAFSAAFTALLLWKESGAETSADQFTEELICGIYSMLCSEPGTDDSVCWPKNLSLDRNCQTGEAKISPASPSAQTEVE